MTQAPVAQLAGALLWVRLEELSVGDELTRMRERLATQVIAANHIGSDLVADALWTVPRHLFLPDLPPQAAYRDDAIVTKRDADGLAISSSSQPGIVAIMLDQLDLAPGHRVLEIGAGTGYNAALMRHIVGPSGRVAAELAPDTEGLHVDAYPKANGLPGTPSPQAPAGLSAGRMVADRPGTWFVVYRTRPRSADVAGPGA